MVLLTYDLLRLCLFHHQLVLVEVVFIEEDLTLVAGEARVPCFETLLVVHMAAAERLDGQDSFLVH